MRNFSEKIQISVDDMPVGTVITIEIMNNIPRLSFHVERTNASEQNHTSMMENAWEQDNVVLQGGTKIRFDYRNERFQGIVQNGLLVFEDGLISKKSPTGAAMAAIRNRFGDAPNLNGWAYISRYDEDNESWDALSDLRPSEIK